MIWRRRNSDAAACPCNPSSLARSSASLDSFKKVSSSNVKTGVTRTKFRTDNADENLAVPAVGIT